VPKKGLGDRPADPAAPAPAPADLVRITTHLEWAEAHVLQSLLESEGIPVVLADTNLATAHPFLSSATGGIRALVHAKNLTRAQEVIAALKRGDFELDESFDYEKPKT
jgi:hypothetical protein